MIRQAKRHSPVSPAPARHERSSSAGPASRVGKIYLIAALCLVLTLLPVSLPSAAADTPGRGYINYNKVYFRKTPSTGANAEYWCFLDYNWPVTILSSVFNTYGTWYEIRTALPADTSRVVDGYVLTRYVSVLTAPVTSAPTAVPSAAPADSQLAYVNTDRVYFRRDAGYRSDILAVLPIDWPVLVTGFAMVNGVKWIAVTASLPEETATAYSGYIHSDYITMGTPATPAPEELLSPDTEISGPPDEFSGYALVIYGGVNVRLTASPTSASVTALQAGQTVEVLSGVGEDAVYIRAQAAEGYVSADSLYLLSLREYAELTDPASSASEETPAEAAAPDPDAFSGFAMVLNEGAGVRLAADPAFLYFAALYAGTVVEVTDGAGGDMVRIRAENAEGYMPAEDLAFLSVREYLELTETAAPEATADETATAEITASPAPAATAEPAPTPMYQVLGYIQLTRGGVNLRETPNGASLNPTAEKQLNMYTYLPYLKQPVYVGGYYWVYVFSDDLNLYGYIRSDCCQFVTATPTPEPAADSPRDASGKDGAAVTGYLRLTAPSVNLRKTPNGATLTPRDEDRLNVTSPIPYYGVPVSAGGYKWALVEYNGMTGYIRSDCYELLLSTETPEPTAEPEPALRGYIILTADKVNIRKTPGGSILDRADVKTIFPCYGETEYEGETWYMIYHQGKKSYAYVLGSLARTYTYITPSPTPSPVPEETPVPVPAAVTANPAATPEPVAAYGYVMTTASKVYIRLSPGASSMALTLVADAGTVIITTGDRTSEGKDAWYPVFYNGFNGYISGAFVRELSPWQAEIYLASGVVPTPSPVPDISAADETAEAAGRTGDETPDSSAAEETLALPASEGTPAEGIPVEEKIYTGEETLLPAFPDETDEYLLPTSDGELEVVIPEEYRLLSLNCVGDDVTEVQKALVLLNYLEETEISGEYLASTQSAVLNFQLDFDLMLTGIVDEETWNSIFSCFVWAE